MTSRAVGEPRDPDRIDRIVDKMSRAVGEPRDPDRIDRIVEKLRLVWHQYPDQRLGQLVCNLLTGNAPWIVEDDIAEHTIDAWIEQECPVFNHSSDLPRET